MFIQLVLAGADINRRYKYGKTLTYIAAEKNALNFVGVLAKQGADLNAATTLWGQTPLYVASKKGYLQVVKHLLSCQANPSLATTVLGQTPLTVAKGKETREFLKRSKSLIRTPSPQKKCDFETIYDQNMKLCNRDVASPAVMF